MQNQRGVFIVLEGSDGSGKGTQFRLLSERLKAVGHEVAVFDFPRYENPSSYFVKRYLNADYGPANEVSPYTASIFYALDRYEAASQITKALNSGKLVLANRYVGSNMAHQGAKFNNLAEQRGFFMWAEALEYQLLGIPRPDINLFLKVPAEISYELITKKAQRSYTLKKRDEHEADKQHIQRSVANYDLLCKLFPKDFKEINCTRGGQILSIVEINNLIWQTIKPLLPQPRRQGRGAVVMLERPQRAKVVSKKATDMRKTLLSKAESITGLDHKQLRSAIDLVTPLGSRKNEIKDLVKEEIVDKKTNDDEPVPLDKIISKISESMPASADNEFLKLLKATPRNEFQVLGESKTAGLNYRQKQQLLNSELQNVASKLIYDFEIISNFNLLLVFRTEVTAKQITLLAASPLLGYKIPEIIETAGLEEPFNKVFEHSNKLYRQAVSSGNKDAIYNLLLGHNVRWKFVADAAALSKALRSIKNSELLIFLAQIRDKITENHPRVGKILTINH